MVSIPQLRKDINDLQEKLRHAQSRIAELEAKPPVVVKEYVQSPPEVRIVYRDKIVEVPGPDRIVYRDKIVEVPGPDRIVYRDKIVEVPGPKRTVYKTKEVLGPERVVHIEVPGPERVVADPAQSEMIRKLQAKLRLLNADIL